MKKVHNTVTNNIIVAETGTTGGVLSIIEGGGGQPESEGFGYHTVTKNVFFAKGSSSTLYRFNEDEFDRNMVSVSNHNLFYVEGGGTYMFQGIIGDDTHEQWKTLYSGKYDKNSINGNPLFVDKAHHNFNLKANSPAWALGFQQIDQENIGLRNSYPVVHSPWPYDRQSQGTFADVLSWTGGHRPPRLMCISEPVEPTFQMRIPTQVGLWGAKPMPPMCQDPSSKTNGTTGELTSSTPTISFQKGTFGNSRL